MNNLGFLYETQGRYSEAEPLFKRALHASERLLGENHPQTLGSMNNLAAAYKDQGQYAKAEPLLKRALAASERVLGKEHPQTLGSANNLAELYRAEGLYGEAEPLYRSALDGRQRVLGPEHLQTLLSASNLGSLYRAEGRYQEAEPLYQRALEGRERALGSEHPFTLASLNNLAALFFDQGDWPHAALFWQLSTNGVARRVHLDGTQTVAGKKKSEAERLSWQFSGLVKAAYRLEPDGSVPHVATSREMFQTAQWALSSEAAASLAQMAARGATGDPKLAALVRERQDQTSEWQIEMGSATSGLGFCPEKRNAEAEAENSARLAAIEARALLSMMN